jgi:hypothetical protein
VVVHGAEGLAVVEVIEGDATVDAKAPRNNNLINYFFGRIV